MRYSIDTSALMEAEVRHYPQAIFPTLWGNLQTLVDAGALVASEEVANELSRDPGTLNDWCRAHARMFVTSDARIQGHVGRLITTYTGFVLATGQSGGDPFVVAVAIEHNLTVVTQERRVGPGGGRPKIPNVCAAEGVPCITLLEMIRREGWTF